MRLPNKVSTALFIAFACCATSSSLQAALIGELPGGLAAVGLTSGGIDFFPPNANPGGLSTVAAGSTGAFAAVAGTAAQVLDLNFASQPVGTPISLPGFVTLPAQPTAAFNLTFINPGTMPAASCGAAPAVGQTCTLPGSALNLANTPGGATASFSVQGTFVSGSSSAPFTAVFATQFAGRTYQQVLATIGANGIAQASYSASISVASGPSAGTLNLGPQSAVLTAGGIDFSPTGLGTGNFIIGTTASGPYAGLSMTTAQISDLNFATTPVGVPTSLPGFLILTAQPTLPFVLTSISPGVFTSAQCSAAPAVGQTCSLGGYPFNFMNVAGGSTVSFSVLGQALNTATSEQSPFVALFTAEFAGHSYQELEFAIFNGGVQLPYSVDLFAGSGTPTSPPTVPEPSTWILLLTACAILRLCAAREVLT